MKVFCVTCRTMREVMDTYTTGPLGEEYLAQPLECGHDGSDGGGRPPRRRQIRDRALVERVAELQRDQPR